MHNLIKLMSEHQVFPYLENGKLKTRSASNSLPSELVTLIKKNKESLVEYLKSIASTRDDTIVRLQADHSELKLSFNQERLWLTNQINEGSAQYNISTAFKLTGRLDLTAFQAAFDTLLRRHEVLRTQFIEQNGDCQLRLSSLDTMPIAVIDLTHLADEAQQQLVQEQAKLEAAKPFDLACDLMLRLTLLKLTDESNVLLFTQHHIASDGWSIGILVKEFSKLYSAHIKGATVNLAELPIRYVDFAQWQRNKFTGSKLEAAFGFWREKLANIPKLHNLPLDKTRPAKQGYTGKRLVTRLDSALTQQIKHFAESRQATLFMVLQCFYALLIAKFSGDEDVVIGSPIAGRNHVSTESVVGFFANALVYRNQILADDTFDTLLARCKNYSTAVFEYQDMPFSLLVKELEKSRSLSYSPIFQLSFTMQNNDQVQAQLDGLTIDYLAVEQSKTLFDLSLFATESDGAISLEWLYDDQLFCKPTIERFAKTFELLVSKLCQNPQQRLRDVNVARQLDDTFVVATDPRIETQIHTLFEQQVAQRPDANAIYFEDSSWSYAQLNAESNRLAHYLLDKGVSRGDKIGVLLDRSAEMVIAVLAVLKAGAAYIPLDPALPSQRLEYMVTDACITTLITQQSLMNALEVEISTVVLIDEHWRAVLLKKYSTDNLTCVEQSPDDLAYVIYTSGSTGHPKGVMVPHRGLVNNAFVQQAFYDIAAQSNLLQFVSFSFDVATSDWASALTCGAALTILSEQQRSDFHLLVTAANVRRATHLQLPAAVLAQLDSNVFQTLKTLVLGGSQANHQLIEPWLRRGVNVINAYGPTEATVASSANRFTDAASSKNIGKAFPNCAYLVVDKNLHPVQPGVIGELLITGAGLAAGYLNKPELTAAMFVHLTVADVDVRFYRTGDVVRLCHDGSCEFIGRLDDQVKLRGFRVELGEIEIALRSLAGVKDVSVCVRPHNGSQQLVAYFVAEEPVPAEQSVAVLGRWRLQLEGLLPDYMIPHASMIVTELPLTSNGKVDKKALPDIDVSAGSSADYLAPRNEIELILCDIWKALLKVDNIGVHDNFFALGGDSIISIQVVARAKQAGLALTTKQLFSHQTIAELATQVQSHVEVLPQEDIVGSQMLLPIQRQFLLQSDGHYNHFNQSVLLQTPQAFTLQDCKDITSAIYRRHDVLRLSFAPTSPWQATYQPLTQALVDASCAMFALEGRAFSAEVTSLCESAQRSFDITAGPLFKMWLMTDGQQQRLFIVAHHLVVDGVSWRILLSDIERAYNQLVSNQSISLAAKTSSYQAWGRRLSELASAAHIASTKDYWLQQNQPAAPLPKDFVSSASCRGDSATVSITLNSMQTTALLSKCSIAYSTHVNELLLSALVIGLKQWSNLHDFNIVLEGHGREELGDPVDLTETLGWFTTTYPLYVGAQSDDIATTIIQCKELLRAVPHKGLSYGVLQYLTDTLPSAPYHNSIAFNYLGQFDQSINQDSTFSLADEMTGTNIGAQYPRVYSLGINGKVVAGKLSFNLDYSVADYSKESMSTLALQIENALIAVIAHCEQAVAVTLTPSDFPLAQVTQTELFELQSQFDIAKIYPATPMQKGMLYHSQLDKGAYVSQALPLLKGELNVGWLKQAWQHVVGQFDIFRTVFVGHGERINQVVLVHTNLTWQEHDWRALCPKTQQSQLSELVLQDRRRGFAIGSEPLQRITVITMADDTHRLIWTHHHALIDGWCSGIVYQAVLAAYSQLAAGRPVALPPAAPQYQRYIEWLVNKDLTEAKEFWKRYLEGVEHATDLAIMVPGKPAAEDQRMVSLDFSKQQTAKIQGFVSKHATTVNTLLQFVWGYILHRYSGDESVVFGTPISGRPPEVDGVEQMVGLFINSVPVRVNFSGDNSIGGRLKLLQKQFQQCNEYGYVPLTDIQAQSDIAKGQALFNSMFIFENYPLDVALNESAERQKLPFVIEDYQSFEGAAYPLALSAALREQLKMKLYFDSASVRHSTIERLLEQIAHVLAQLVDEVPLQEVTLIPSQQQEALELWRNSAKRPLPHGTVSSWFSDIAETYADRCALVCGEQTVTYTEFETYANQMARKLIAAGVCVEDKVAVLLDRSLESFIALMAILKAGAAYVPIDMSNPQDRIEYMLQASHSKLVIATPTHHGTARQLGLPVVEVVLDSLKNIDGNRLPNLAKPDNLAYIIFTSGSTGQPKGVMIEHKSLLNLIKNDVERYQLTAESKLLHCTSMGFDAGTAHMFKVIGGGGELHIVEPRSELESYINARQITHLALPVARLEMMNECELSSLKVLITGADTVSSSLVGLWAKQCKFFNVYGPTEITIAATTGQMFAGDLVTIGTANNNYYLYVLDAQQKEVPIGVAGELYIGGVGVARGYVGQPDLTCERFIANPFGHEEAPRLYRTGDLVRITESGTLEFIGRIDKQVKIRGYRIELSEVKAVAQQFKGVKEVSIGVFGSGADKKLLCHYSTTSGEEYDSREIRAFMADKLPEYMLPSFYVHVLEMPLTPNGKIDHRKLPELNLHPDYFYVAPRTEIETKVAEIWAQCLGLEKVGVESNFFELGGNSLHLAKVLYEINAALKIQLELKSLFEALTISEIAQLIEPLMRSAGQQMLEELEEGVL